MAEAPINMPWIDLAFFEQMLEASDLDAGTRGLVQAYAVDGYVIIDPENRELRRTGRRDHRRLLAPIPSTRQWPRFGGRDRMTGGRNRVRVS